MATITQMRARWREINGEGLVEIAKESLSENADSIVTLLQDQLYTKGLDGSDAALKIYSQSTVESGYVEAKDNPRLNADPFDSYDLKNTGSFYDGMYLELGAATMEIQSNGATTSAIEAASGANVRRLDTDSKNKLRENILQPSMVRKIALRTGCGT